MPEISIVTSMSYELYKKYASGLIETYIEYNIPFPLHIYTEDDTSLFPNENKITVHEIGDDWKAFQERNKHRKFNGYMQDAVRFSTKVFSQYNHYKNIGGKFIWLDADCIFLDILTESWVDKMLQNSFVAFYDRPGLYTECGVIFFDTTKKVSDNFFRDYIRYYEDDYVYMLPYYTDCHVFDAVRSSYQDILDYKENKLGQYQSHKNMHVMALDPNLAPFIDHKKGNRKNLKNSPELLK